MPKLTKAAAKAVDQVESTSFAPYDPGLYVVVLEEVQAGPELQGPAGPYWKAICSVESTYPDLEEARKGKTFDNLSLSDAAAWKMKQFFEAFGVPADTDTDEMIGHKVVQRLGITTIQKGPRAGEDTTDVVEWCTYEAEAVGDEDPF